MTTTLDLIERTRRHLYSGETRDERDQLNGTINAGATGILVQYGSEGVQKGAQLAIDLEELYVYEKSSGNVVVSRGEGGSTAAAHTSGTAIYVNPKFSAFAILQAINEELGALSAEGLFQVRTVSLDFEAGTDAYDLTSVTDLIDITDVHYDNADGAERWATLPATEWKLRRDLPVADFSSGLSLTVNGYASSGYPLVVGYKAAYGTLATLADNVETTTGLHAQAHDIVPLGAAIRLTAGNEVSRNTLDQYETRRADEVPPGARLGQMRAMMLLRDRRINDEKARLYAKYPAVR